jgi:hypothetical protein
MSEGETVVVKRPHPALRLVNLLTIAGGVVLLVLSLWPGFVIGCLIVLAYPLILILGLVWLFLALRAVPKPMGRGAAIPLKQILIAPLIVCTTYGMLRYYIPRRVAFRAHMSQFEKHIPAATATTRPILFNRWLGIYRVDEIRHDTRGGVYFRTGTGGDGIGPDRMSYGFVHRPNTEGTPFGRKLYLYRRVAGDWYWFQASDDYY